MTATETATVVERPEHNRFELAFDGGIAFANFRRDGDRLVVTHTEVPARFNGQGIGSRLARGLFDNAHQTGRKIVPACSFIADWARRHPDYADVVAQR